MDHPAWRASSAFDYVGSGETRMITLYNRVIVAKRIPEENLVPGDVGTVVEEYRDPQGKVIGYELESFSADGHTLAVSSVPADAVREATPADRLCSRTEAAAI